MTASIRSSSTLAFDTNIFINALANESSFKESANEILEQVKEKSPKAFISVLVLEEFFIRLFRENLQAKIPYYMGFVTAGGTITIIDVTREIAIKAAQIRAEFRVKAPDAIHLATAIESKAKIFITTDRRLPRKINGLKIEILSA